MQHFADFGYVKQANKQLKRLNEISGNLGSTAQENVRMANLAPKHRNIPVSEGMDLEKNKSKKYLENTLRKTTRTTRKNITDPLSEPHHYREISVLPNQKNVNGFSDVREIQDRAASPTGYLGFRTDPYKGYGGMMEEPIPLEELKFRKMNYVRRKVN